MSKLSTHVESYRFWEVVSLWAKERLEHESVVARALASAVINDGLLLHSKDPRWLAASESKLELKGSPFVGYSANRQGETMVIRREALSHLEEVVRRAEEPSRGLLSEEFILKKRFC